MPLSGNPSTGCCAPPLLRPNQRVARDRDRPVYLGGTPARLSAVLSRARAAHGPPPEVYSFHLGLDECREIALHTSTPRRRQRRAAQPVGQLGSGGVKGRLVDVQVGTDQAAGTAN